MPKCRWGSRPHRSSRYLAAIAWTRQVAPGTRGAVTRTAQISRSSGITVRIRRLPLCRARTLETHRNGRTHKTTLTQANRIKLCSTRLRSAELRRQNLRTIPTPLRLTLGFGCRQHLDQNLRKKVSSRAMHDRRNAYQARANTQLLRDSRYLLPKGPANASIPAVRL
jgi:hypothetical protein